MNTSLWTRQLHRWLSIAFTLTVIANFVVRVFEEPPLWVVYSPLIPLFLLLFSGLYLFAASGNLALFVQEAPLDQSAGVAEWDGINEIQIAARLNERDIHARGGRVGDDLLDLGNRKIAARFLRFSRFVVDDPVANAGFDASHVLTRKLVLFSGTVFVDRIGPVDEDAERHESPLGALARDMS
jgi:hypothetical protein